MRTAIALGAEVGAIVGSYIYELEASGGSYEDYHEYTVAFFPDEESAQTKMLLCIYEASEFIDETPWGLRPQDEEEQIDPHDSWYLARQAWFQSHSFEEITKWYAEEANKEYSDQDYKINVHTISSTPALEYKLPVAKES